MPPHCGFIASYSLLLTDRLNYSWFYNLNRLRTHAVGRFKNSCCCLSCPDHLLQHGLCNIDVELQRTSWHRSFNTQNVLLLVATEKIPAFDAFSHVPYLMCGWKEQYWQSLLHFPKIILTDNVSFQLKKLTAQTMTLKQVISHSIYYIFYNWNFLILVFAAVPANVKVKKCQAWL